MPHRHWSIAVYRTMKGAHYKFPTSNNLPSVDAGLICFLEIGKRLFVNNVVITISWDTLQTCVYTAVPIIIPKATYGEVAPQIIVERALQRKTIQITISFVASETLEEWILSC